MLAWAGNQTGKRRRGNRTRCIYGGGKFKKDEAKLKKKWNELYEGDLKILSMKKARQGSQMQEMREGEVLSLALLPVWEEADAADRVLAKPTFLFTTDLFAGTKEEFVK